LKKKKNVCTKTKPKKIYPKNEDLKKRVRKLFSQKKESKKRKDEQLKATY
jgi:hypothetical protein